MTILLKIIEIVITALLSWIPFDKVFPVFNKKQKLLKNRFFPYMKTARNEQIPYWILKSDRKTEIVRCFFKIKVGVFLDETTIITNNFIKTGILEINKNTIYDLVDRYNRLALIEWSMLHPENKAMEVFIRKFSPIHKPNVDKTADRVDYVLDKDCSDYEKLDKILDDLYWAFSLSLPAVLKAVEDMNGELQKELDVLYQN